MVAPTITLAIQVFTALAAATGSYRAGFAAFGSLSLIGALWLLRTHRK